MAWVLAAAALVACPSVAQARSLTQLAAIKPFWAAEVTVPPLSDDVDATAEASIPPTLQTKKDPADFGGCSVNTQCAQLFSVAYRICFVNQDATVEIRTAPSEAEIDLTSTLYLFSAEGDIGPLNGGFVPNAWPPTYQQFWVAPTKPVEIYDANSIQICTTDDEPTVDICEDSTDCVWEGSILTCPSGSTKRLLSGTSFQLRQEPGRAWQCVYAALTAATGTNTMSVGVDIMSRKAQLNPDEAGQSNTTARSGQLTASDIGLVPIGVGQKAEPYIAPTWVALTEPLADTCTLCSGDSWEESRERGMFEYKQICVEQDPVKQQTAFISTRWGGVGWADTTMFVYNDARTIEVFDDFSNLVCSDGSVPSTANCGGTCVAASDRCAGASASLLSLSQVRVPIPAGTDVVCYNVGLGADSDTAREINVGIDVVLWPPAAQVDTPAALPADATVVDVANRGL